jgi:CBS domain-containing protein
MSQEAQPFPQSLASLIPSNQVLVALAPEHSLSHALEVLHAAKITAAPVVKNGKVVGLVDLLDLVAYLAIVAKQALRSSGDHTKTFKFAWGDSLDGLFSKNSSWSTAQVQNIMDLSGRSPLICLPRHAAVSEAIVVFARGCRRLVVVDEVDTPVGVVSQMDAVRQLAAFAGERLSKQLHRTPRELGLLKHVRSIPETDMAINAFLCMHEWHVSSLAVVDDEGRVVGTLSAADIRLISNLSHAASALSKPIKLFVLSGNKAAEKVPQIRDLIRRPLLFADESESLVNILKVFKEHHVHRVYILAPNKHPVGIVSLTNVLQIAIKSEPAIHA